MILIGTEGQRSDVCHGPDPAVGQKKSGRQIQAVTGRAHRHDQTFAVQTNFHRFFNDDVIERFPLP